MVVVGVVVVGVVGVVVVVVVVAAAVGVQQDEAEAGLVVAVAEGSR